MTRHPLLVELDVPECIDLLRAGPVGRVAVVVDGQPVIVPVNYAADEHGTIAFRTGPGTIVSTIALARVAFEVDGIDVERRCGWSVSVRGVGRDITTAPDPYAVHLRSLPVVPWAPGDRLRWFCIQPHEITGRRLEVVGADEEAWMPGVPWS